jgi:hypothetical protein
MKFSKKVPIFRAFIPEPIFSIPYLDRLSNYPHFGMLDRPYS